MSKKPPNELFVILDTEGSVDLAEMDTFKTVSAAKRFIQEQYADSRHLAIGKVELVAKAVMPKIEWQDVESR